MSNEVRRACGARLKEARVAAGLSQAALAGQVGVNQPAVWKWEAGINEPSIETRHLLAAALGADPYAIDVTGAGAA